ncbi:creatinase-like [Diadema antillarum]|uniref:creatinase-like n=1 Tax=Diadema antillarum TaxID=105358 RepID=UPI003A862F41
MLRHASSVARLSRSFIMGRRHWAGVTSFGSIGEGKRTLPSSSRSDSRSVSSAEFPHMTRSHIGAQAQPMFSRNEMHRRIEGLRAIMRANDIGGVLLTSIPAIKYFSDYLVHQFGRIYGLAVTMDRVVTIASLVDCGQAWRRSPVSDDVVLYTDWQRGNYWAVVREQLGGISAKIGAELDHISHANKLKLGETLAASEIVDIGDEIMHMMIVKSDEEIALAIQGSRIADIGGKAVVEASVEGAPEYAILMHATNTMVHEIAKSYPDSEIYDTFGFIQTGAINTDGAHNAPTTRRLEKGDIISMNLFPMIAGYYTALERTMFFDHIPSDEHLHYWEVNCEVHRRGMALLKPGLKCGEVCEELNEVYRERGVPLHNRRFGYGHSIGIMCHYYGREPALELREYNETVLRPGMLVTMEPHLTIPHGQPGDGGYREHDVMLITEEGARSLTGFPFGPEHNVIKPSESPSYTFSSWS